MISFKQIFVILSIASFASAKRGASARKLHYEVDGRLLQTKKGGGAGFTGGSFSGTRAGGDALIEPNGKDCIPFEDAVKWVETGYEGDEKCQLDSTSSTPQMEELSACCRMFEFKDTNGSHKYRYYDINNSRKNLRCICNENTLAPGSESSGGGMINTPPPGSESSGGGMINVPIDTAPIDSVPIDTAPIDTTNREGATGETGISLTGETEISLSPTQCSPGFIGAAQLAHQDSIYTDNCERSSTCPGNQCCFDKYCVCWPTSHLVPGVECIPN